jgi:acetolactate synthase-1/2/3 large subunit
MGIGIDPKLAARIQQCDVMLVVGPRLGEMTTQGYTRLVPPVAAQRLVHVYPAAEELNRVYQAELGIVSGMEAFGQAVQELKAPSAIAWKEWAATARADFEAFMKPVSVKGDVNPSEIFAWLNTRLPEDAILTNGAGNYAGWLHRFFLHRRFHILQTLDRLANGLEVGEHTAQPAMIDERRGATFGFFTNDFLGLAFGANE